MVKILELLLTKIFVLKQGFLIIDLIYFKVNAIQQNIQEALKNNKYQSFFRTFYYHLQLLHPKLCLLDIFNYLFI